jgi:hypothetical protein
MYPTDSKKLESLTKLIAAHVYYSYELRYLNLKEQYLMSTATVTNDQSADVAIKSEVLAYKAFIAVNPDTGAVNPDDIKVVKESAADKKGDALSKNDKYTLGLEANIKSYSVGSDEGFVALIPDAEERLNIINKGIASKFSSKINAMLKDFDESKNAFVFEPTAEPFDSIELLREGTQRRNLSPMERLEKTLRSGPYTEDQIAAVLAAMAAAAQ